jgi:hypothetical protein
MDLVKVTGGLDQDLSRRCHVQLVPVGKGLYVAHALTGEVPAELTYVLPDGVSKPVLRVGTKSEWEGWMKQF